MAQRSKIHHNSLHSTRVTLFPWPDGRSGEGQEMGSTSE